jgi:hypothetical protein
MKSGGDSARITGDRGFLGRWLRRGGSAAAINDGVEDDAVGPSSLPSQLVYGPKEAGADDEATRILDRPAAAAGTQVFLPAHLHCVLGDLPPAEFEDLYVQRGDQLISHKMKIGSN